MPKRLVTEICLIFLIALFLYRFFLPLSHSISLVAVGYYYTQQGRCRQADVSLSPRRFRGYPLQIAAAASEDGRGKNLRLVVGMHFAIGRFDSII